MGQFDNEYKSDLDSRPLSGKMTAKKTKSEKEPETQTKTEIVDALPKIKAMRKSNNDRSI